MKTSPLDRVRVATLCEKSWDDMVGDARRRYCDACGQNVFNLTAMTRAEAESFVNASEGRRCVRYFRRADGTILTRDCRNGTPDELRELVRLGVRVGAFAGLLAGVAVLPHMVPPPAPAILPTVMGEMVAPPPPVEQRPEHWKMGKAAPPPRAFMGDMAVDPAD